MVKPITRVVKHIISIIFSVLLFSLDCHGQLSEIDIAIEANHSNYFIDNVDKTGSGFGMNARVPIRYNFTEILSVDTRPGISFFQPDFSTSERRYRNSFTYLSIPGYLGITPIKEISFYLGTEYEHLLFKNTDEGSNLLSMISQDFVFGLSGGFTYNFRGGLKFTAFYTYGFNSLVKDIKLLDENGDPTGDLTIRKSYLSIGLSYKLFRNVNKGE